MAYKIDPEQLRQSILLYLQQVPGGDGLRPSALLHQLRLNGFSRLDPDTLDTELVYLKDKEFLIAEKSAISAGTMRYRLAPKGREYLEENKFS